jgi:hypothetical protein
VFLKTQENHLPKSEEYIFGQQLSVIGIAFYLRPLWKTSLLNSLLHRSSKGLIDVFGFVIMPNHVHFIWRMNKMNGKEKPFGSFLKYTAHQFKKVIKPSELETTKWMQRIKVMRSGKEIL